MKVFELRQLSHRYGSFTALDRINMSIDESEIVGVVGPNGSGKTTLLKILCGILRGWSGEVLFLEKPLFDWKRRNLARRMAYLSQQTRINFPYTAREVVLMGRIPHQDGNFFESPEDIAAVDRALAMTDTDSLADRFFSDLSGGEQQLVALASALAQEPQVLLLDEPTVFLDLKHQLHIYRILKELHESKELTIVLVTHDLNLAQSFCSRMAFLKKGEVAADLRRESGRGFMIPPELVGEVFGVTAQARGADRIVLSL